jgi:uncharacterized protein (TIGR02996 family)
VGLQGSLDLDASRQALERAALATEPDEVLGSLLAAWRTHHHPAIAELVDAAATRAIARTPPRKPAGTLAEQHAQWMANVREHRPIDLAWLFDNFAPPRGDLALARIVALATWPDDPRVVIGLCELCRIKPLVTQNRLWTRVFAQIRARLARHALPLLRELAAGRSVTAFDQRLHSRLALHVHAAEALPELPEPDAALVAKIASALDLRGARASRRTIDDLLREVWAAPNDDGPRHVLADWLTERSDPRGELIALQLARARRTADAAAMRRERALLDQHGRSWLGPLEPVVITSSFVAFERGFLSRCEVAWRRLAAMPHLMTHVAWSTVREYRLASEGERLCDVWLDHMIALGAKRV